MWSLSRGDLKTYYINFLKHLPLSECCFIYLLFNNLKIFCYRYVGSGNTIQDLEFKFKRGKSTIACMILRVCEAIWKHLLRDNIPELTTDRFQKIASDFDVRANFPHCVGAIDGKHIRMCNPANSGSLFFNYKSFFSMVLLAVVDSNYKFTFVDIGAYGKECDSTVFQNSKLYELMICEKLPLPDPQPLCGFNRPIPCVSG
jgi:hypothetical protein